MNDNQLTDPFTATDPFALFGDWMAAAQAGEPINPDAACLSTFDGQGTVSSRMVLIKAYDRQGFVFYTDLGSAKSRQLKSHDRAALCFYWRHLERQVTVEGRAEPVDGPQADAYFASRPRGSQIAAWASEQSQPLDSRAVLEARVAEIGAEYRNREVPRPPGWSGFRIVPNRIEFWQGRPDRLHDRLAFRERDGQWVAERLAP